MSGTCSIVAASVIGMAIAGGMPTYEATVLPQLDDTNDPNRLTFTTPNSINDSRTIVGILGNERGFTWSPSEGGAWLQPQFSHVADSAGAACVNSAGDISGTYRVLGGGFSDIRPFHLADDGTFTTLPLFPGDQYGAAADMNDNGMAIGFTGSGLTYWILQAGQFDVFVMGNGLGGPVTSVSALNTNGVAVGYGNTLAVQAVQAIKWTQAGGFVQLPALVADLYTSANDINDHNVIVGRSAISGAHNRPVYWDANNVIHELPSLLESYPPGSGVDCQVLAINDAGAMVGYEVSSVTLGFKALIWINDEVSLLQNLVVNLPNGYTLARAVDINNNGDIAVEASAVVNEQVQFVTVLLTPVIQCAADLANGDGVVDVFDLFILLSAWGSGGAGAALAEPNNVVDVFDLFVLLSAWGPCN